VNRADMVAAVTACDVLAGQLRKALRADALHEFTENHTAATWRLPGHTVSTSISHDSVYVSDEDAFLHYVRQAYPTEVETVTITRVRAAWRAGFLKDVAERGFPPADPEGTVVPGLTFEAGGHFVGVSVRPTAAYTRQLRQIADEIVTGVRPLGLPAGEVDE
jgi:hypothetical protein